MPPPKSTTLALLAGGKARRLGGIPKGLIEVDGRSCLDRLLEHRGLFDEVLLVTGAPAPYAEFCLRSVPDVVADRGAPGGVHAALAGARTEWVLVAPVDMPFLIHGVLARLLEERAAQVRAAAFSDPHGPVPLPSLWRAAEAGVLEAQLRSGTPSIAQLLAAVDATVLPRSVLERLDPESRCLTNLNTAEDLRSHRALAPPTVGRR